jgi:hypothetical protein
MTNSTFFLKVPISNIDHRGYLSCLHRLNHMINCNYVVKVTDHAVSRWNTTMVTSQFSSWGIVLDKVARRRGGA